MGVSDTKIDNVIAEVSVVPIGTGGTSLSPYVAGCLAVLEKDRKIKYRLTPMGTIIEGRLREVIGAALKMHEVPFTAGIARVVTTIKIDDRRDKSATMDSKLKSVMARRQKTRRSRGQP